MEEQGGAIPPDITSSLTIVTEIYVSHFSIHYLFMYLLLHTVTADSHALRLQQWK